MSEYDDKVERQRLLLEAEEWSKGIVSIHSHSLKSMWYDDRPQDTDKGMVIDTQYNDGTITREQDGVLIHTFATAIKGDDLIRAYLRGGLWYQLK